MWGGVIDENDEKKYESTMLFYIMFLGLLLSFSFPSLAADTAEKVVRVGWYEDSYNITGANGERSGYNYEYEQAVPAGLTNM